ncbi:hypothetical protein FRC09_003776 [Ceratobasidium sp. 395]|nr:hypothetical protein FRC09_003776 [Ceratobasidium sp. 395]
MNSTTFRVRVQTASPLEPLKAWHIVAPESGTKTIRDLTRDIVLVLGLEGGGEFSLELDGFALLPSSPIGVVRDGDIILVKYQLPTEKRKAAEAAASTSESGTRPKKKQMTRSPPRSSLAAPLSTAPGPSSSIHTQPTNKPHVPPRNEQSRLPLGSKSAVTSSSESSDTSDSESSSHEESSSESDSSDSGSSSDSDSESESDSGSESDSDSTSSSDGPPRPQPISQKSTVRANVLGSKPVTSPFIQPPKIPNPLHPPVPPGYGKQSTKDRNVRRRKLQKHKAAGTATVGPRVLSAPVSASATSITPPNTNTITTQIQPAAPIASAKNANKNKRRGFDQDMASLVATRTVFDESRVSVTPAPALAPRPSSTPMPTAPVDPAPSTQPSVRSRYTHYHVVPPSQLPNLPSNVIVTSVDVEAVDGMEGVGEWFDGEAGARDVGTVDVMEDIQTTGGMTQKVDWRLVDGEWEMKWDEFKVVGDGWMELKTGSILGWQDLMIDPATFTPCMRIHLARVIGTPDLTSNQVECFFIERPGAGDVIFGFGRKYTGEREEQDGDEEVGENRTVAAGDISGWKILIRV